MPTGISRNLTATFNAVAALAWAAVTAGVTAHFVALVGILSLAVVSLAGRDGWRNSGSGHHAGRFQWRICWFPKQRSSSSSDWFGPLAGGGERTHRISSICPPPAKIGDYLTGAFETVFSLPNDLEFRSSGSLFRSSGAAGASGHQERAADSDQPNFYEFYRECITQNWRRLPAHE